MNNYIEAQINATTYDDISVIRNYKDTVFRILYNDKRELLSLYNAMNGTNYTDETALKITTLDNAVFMNMKNDVSFILDMRLMLYEQQSTVNPNMPLRDLLYLSITLQSLLIGEDIYSTKTIKIPNPRFVVFYNGVQPQPAIKQMKLSDMYEVSTEDISLELIVTQYNINKGFNEAMVSKCPTLFQYIEYTDKVRRYSKTMNLKQAVVKAVDECIRENILKDFLLKNKSEVINMTIFEYDEELHKQTLLREGYEDGYTAGAISGRQEGRQEGMQEGIQEGITMITRKMKARGDSYENISAITGLSHEEIDAL